MTNDLDIDCSLLTVHCSLIYTRKGIPNNNSLNAECIIFCTFAPYIPRCLTWSFFDYIECNNQNDRFMKKLSILFFLIVLCVATLFAQAPEKFSYQAVVRNASNALVTDAPVGVRVNILQGGVNGMLVYMETHTAVTNANGLVTLQVGGGTVLQGVFVDIDWANGPFFLKTETDPAGGSNYTVTSTQQMLSVPYALYAKEAGNVPQSVGELTNDANYITLTNPLVLAPSTTMPITLPRRILQDY